MAQQNRRQVSIRSADWQKATRLQEKASIEYGRKVTITDTIATALGCLEQRPWPHSGGDSNDEHMPCEEFRTAFVSLLSQFIARTMPERRLRKVTLEPGEESGSVETIVVHLDDREIPLFMGRVVTTRMGVEVAMVQAVPCDEPFMPELK